MANQLLSTGDVELTLALTRVQASCPSCGGDWGDAPIDPCPHCELPVSIRRLGQLSLVAEDPALLAGEQSAAEAESIDCPSCGTPISTEGDARKLPCPSCSREVVIPDALWRRLHAPSSVATWWLHSDGGASDSELTTPLDLIHAMCADDNHVYIVAGYKHKHVLIAMKNRMIAWMADLKTAGSIATTTRVCCSPSAVHIYGLMARGVTHFDPSTGEQVGQTAPSAGRSPRGATTPASFPPPPARTAPPGS